MTLTIEKLDLSEIKDHMFPVYWHNPHHYVFQVTHNDEHIGLFCFWNFNGIANIRQLLITEEQRGKGYAFSIIEHLQLEAKKRDIHTLYVHDDMEAFWMKHGFVHDDKAPKWLYDLPNIENERAKGFLKKHI